MTSKFESQAPIVVTVHDRVTHFRKTISSLAANAEAKESLLYVASDGARNESESRKIDSVRSFIREISGFKEVISIEPDHNTGGKVRDELLSLVRTEHESFIFTEDDNVFSPVFLEFVNEGLRRYKNDFRIRAICGYTFPGFKSEEPHPIFLKAFTPWGFGTWSNRDPEASESDRAISVLTNPLIFREMNSTLPHLIRLNRKVILEGLCAEDAHRTNDMFLKNQLCVFPPVSLVRNIGSDGTGQNSKRDVRFNGQDIGAEPPRYESSETIATDVAATTWFRKYSGGKVVSIFNYIIFWEFQLDPSRTSKVLRTFNDCLILLGGLAQNFVRHIRNTLKNP